MENNFLKNLSEMQKDALKEIGNIGAGNAATAFAQFLDRKIDMTVPTVEIKPISMVPEITGDIEQEVGGILLNVMGEAPANILFLLSDKSLKHLLKVIIDREPASDGFSEIEISAIKEIGNILSGSYLSAINQMTGFSLVQSVPAFAYDMAGAILSASLAEMSIDTDYTLLIETQFLEGEYEIEGYFFLIPHPGSLKKILSGLGFDVNEE